VGERAQDPDRLGRPRLVGAEGDTVVEHVGAGGDEDHDVLGPDHAVELVEQRRDHRPARLGPGAVAHRDRHGLAGAHPVAQRRAGRGSSQRGAHCLPLVGHGVELAGGDDGGAVGRDVDHETGLAERQLDLHGITRSGSSATPAARRPASP
jgi:hypothetical protein